MPAFEANALVGSGGAVPLCVTCPGMSGGALADQPNACR